MTVKLVICYRVTYILTIDARRKEILLIGSNIITLALPFEMLRNSKPFNSFRHFSWRVF